MRRHLVFTALTVTFAALLPAAATAAPLTPCDQLAGWNCGSIDVPAPGFGAWSAGDAAASLVDEHE